VLHCSLQLVRVALLTTVARRVAAPGDAFELIDVLAALPASAKRFRPRLDVSVEFVGIVEGRYHNVSTLAAIRVVSVVRDDPAGDAVIVWIHLGHAGSIRPTAIWAAWRSLHCGFVSMAKQPANESVLSAGDRRA
jgi:hypothetical protein